MNFQKSQGGGFVKNVFFLLAVIPWFCIEQKFDSLATNDSSFQALCCVDRRVHKKNIVNIKCSSRPSAQKCPMEAALGPLQSTAYLQHSPTFFSVKKYLISLTTNPHSPLWLFVLNKIIDKFWLSDATWRQPPLVLFSKWLVWPQWALVSSVSSVITVKSKWRYSSFCPGLENNAKL